MYQVVKTFHSYWAYAVLITLVLALANAVLGYLSSRTFTDRDRRLTLFALIAVHVHLLLALVLYVVSPLGSAQLSNLKMAMKDATARLYVLEHPLTMLIAIVLITVGYSRAKRLTVDRSKFGAVASLYGVALVLILIRLPWKAWLGV